MNRTRLTLCSFLLTWLGVAGSGELAAQLVPLGPEVDLFARTWPEKPFAAVQPGGAYVVAWDEGGSAFEVFYRYVAAGSTPGDVNPSTIWSPDDSYPSVDAVTATPKGFDVLWHEPVHGKPVAFFRQHLNEQGAPVGNPIRLGGPGTEWVWHVRGNGFMAGWTLRGKRAIAARRLSSSGRPSGKEMRLNSRPIDSPDPVVLAVADGGFVAVWQGYVPGPARTAVLRARRFSPAGKPLGPDFDVNTIPLGVAGSESYVDPSFKVAAAPGGGFAVAWLLGDTIYLRFFNAAGAALGPEIPAATSVSLYHDNPESLAFDSSGNLLLLWGQELEEIDLRLQLFDPRGVPLGAPVGVRSEASDIFEAPWGGRVVWTGDSWLVTWAAAGMPAGDFSTVFVRRFGTQK